MRSRVVFFSDLGPDSLKQERLTSVVRMLVQRQALETFYGVDEFRDRYPADVAELRNHDRIRLSPSAWKLRKAFGTRFRPFGLDSIGHYVGVLDQSRLIRKNGQGRSYDVLFTQPYFPAIVRDAVAAGVPVVLEADGGHPMHWWQVLRQEERAEGVSRFRAERFNFKKYVTGACQSIELATKVIVFSTHAADSFIQYGVPVQKLEIIPPTVELSSPVQVTLPQRPVFLSVAAHSLRKGTHHLLRSWKAADLADAELFLIGSIQPTVKHLTRDARRPPNVHILGRQPIPEVFGTVSGCFVLPSLLEGRPRTVLEAMSCGMPAIVYPAASCDVVKNYENGFLIQDQDDLTARIRELGTNWSLCERMGAQAKKDMDKERRRTPYSESVFSLLIKHAKS